MIFIHGSLAMGGVETFILRMAKQRAIENKNTVIILLSAEERSDKGLIAQAKKYATLLFMPDLTYLPRWIARYFPFHLSLLLPIRSDLGRYLIDAKHVHVTCGVCAYFYAHIAKYLPTNVKFTVGVYHSLEFCWNSTYLPYFERKNRALFFDRISKSSIIFFNESMVPFYESFSGQSFRMANLFPLGVIEPCLSDSQQLSQLYGSKGTLKLVSVGRLVPFKTYNLHMIEVVAKLHQEGITCVYDVYGDGPLEQEMKKMISERALHGYVNLKGGLDYDRFAEVVSTYDIFIGSGSAIVQAAGLGVSGIIGIENTTLPETYGFLGELEGFSYNEDGLYDKKSLTAVLRYFNELSTEERTNLSRRHIVKAKEFSMAQCVYNFDNTPPCYLETSDVLGRFPFILKFCYSLSLFFSSLKARLSKSSLSERVREKSA